MTNEERKYALKIFKLCVNDGIILEGSPLYIACKTAKEALEQEPCTDAISRQAVLDLTGKSDWFESSDDYNDFVIAVCELPPVNPQEPKSNIKTLGDEMRICQKSITDEKVLIGFNMAVAICNKHLAESEG